MIQIEFNSLALGQNFQHPEMTDGQGETSIPPFNFAEAGDIIKKIPENKDLDETYV